MKLAFDILGNDKWTAGGIYLRNLFLALNSLKEDRPEIFLVSRGKRIVKKEELKFLGIKTLLYGCLEDEGSINENGNNDKSLREIDPAFEQCLIDNKIDVFIGSPYAHNLKNIPTISILADFQHIYFPEFFSEQEIEDRNRYFLEAAKKSSAIILPGGSSLEDFANIFPDFANKARVFHPIAVISEQIFQSDSSYVLSKYKLPKLFFYFPAQFWKHKNHQLLFQALTILKYQIPDFHLVCSGNTHDYRFPQHFSELEELIKKLELTSSISILGMIPYEDVLALMKQSIGVINPSFYEGYGMTVDEANQLGKPIALSDIASHHERNPLHPHYFDPHNFVELSAILIKLWKEHELNTNFDIDNSEFRTNFANRAKECAKHFINLCVEANNG